MKINEHTALSSPTVLLVPYSRHHVPPYHDWMQDPELQAATASEPLSLEEEYAMQESWRRDSDKLTFIICAAKEEEEVESVKVGQDDSPEKMIGDINLFLFRPDSEEDEDVQGVIGEIELMIAVKVVQRKGYGRAALLVFLDYILSNWDDTAKEYAQEDDNAPQLSFLRVKVNMSNTGSIRLFESVGFKRTRGGANYFDEVELRWLPNLERLRRQKTWQAANVLEYQE